MEDPKQLIVDRVKQATNILVTVENNPSVDELAAALALTLMLNKMDKHATAVFSGAVPPAINFLEPNKTFENTVDSLRDFIIALDKDKADRLRYKVEDDVVKIFITPYQSRITEKDLKFSQGDFNVEVVMALGVEKRESLDRAIAAHGRILHDATVITVNARNEHSDLGVVDWQDGKSSSICEMLVSLADALQPKLLDAQISTALLTGIVAATDRFSNDHTTPHSMTIAAELMAAGANQQLIANNLKQEVAAAAAATDAGGKIVRTDEAKKEGLSEESKKVAEAEPPIDGSKGEMKIRHEEEEEKPAEEAKPETPPAAEETKQNESESIPMESDELKGLREALNATAANPLVTATKPTPAPTPPAAPATAAPTPPAGTPFPRITPAGQYLESKERPNWQRLEPPTLGGTLNATSAEAEEARRREAEEEQKHNNVTLNHGGTASGMPSHTISPDLSPAGDLTPPAAPVTPPPTGPAFPPLPPIQTPPPEPPAAPQPPAPSPAPTAPVAPAPTPPPETPEKGPTLAQTESDLEAARKAVDDALFGGTGALGSQPPAPSAPPSQPPAAPANNQLPPAPGPAAPPSGMPPLPDFSTLPPLPPMPSPGGSSGSNPMVSSNVAPGTDVTAQFAPPTPGATPPSPSGPPLPPPQAPPSSPAPGQISNDPSNPNQFRIPGQ